MLEGPAEHFDMSLQHKCIATLPGPLSCFYTVGMFLHHLATIFIWQTVGKPPRFSAL